MAGDRELLQDIRNELRGQRRLLDAIGRKLGLLGERREIERQVAVEKADRARRTRRGADAVHRFRQRSDAGGARG